MKKILAVSFVSLVLGFGIGRCNNTSVYPTTLRITETQANSFKAETSTGIEYTVQESPEDCYVGDLISVIMSEDSTSNDITDDYVIEWRYVGF